MDTQSLPGAVELAFCLPSDPTMLALIDFSCREDNSSSSLGGYGRGARAAAPKHFGVPLRRERRTLYLERPGQMHAPYA